MVSLPTRTACGFVLYRTGGDGALEYLLLTNRKRDEPGLAKGHQESGETELETAWRETEEETGLTDLGRAQDFRREIHYVAERKGKRYDKTVVYFAARVHSGEVRLSPEHSAFSWEPLARARERLPHAVLRDVLRDAALFLKDPALFELEAATEADAHAHLTALPEATADLVAHLEGGAHLARRLAQALADAGVVVHVEATATAAMLHDVGRALGRHGDHPSAGLAHLRETPLAPYGFACISHFTKGTAPEQLLLVGVDPEQVSEFEQLIDIYGLTWEERCVALADACMKGATAVPPKARFDDLRGRYDNHTLIALQERKTSEIRAAFTEVLGRDPLADLNLA